MNEAFQADTEDSRRLLLVQAEAALTAALEQYDIHEKELDFIQVSEHVTYKIEDETGRRYLLRVHPGSASSAETVSEMEWLAYLAEEEGIGAPLGVKNREGSYVTEVETGRGQSWKVSVLRWVEGDHREGNFTESQLLQMGGLLARMHRAARKFQVPEGFVRPVWDEQAFAQEAARLKQHYRSFLTPDEHGVYEQAAAKVTAHMAGMPRDDERFGIIHGDFHEGNLVFKDGEPYPIDFGRCGYGYFLYDLAQAFIGLYPMQRQVFLEGYERLLPVSGEPDDIRVLETFFIKSLIENQSYHAPHPWEAAELRESKPYSLALLRHYLDRKPFLFQAIPV
ncbi:phosphotransferase [Paenibacillus sp. VCA1]|uniref:phosphotransferase enzyme family protein n=1 Tax=Paenibacillus sp. VCA1 TaxID=3039148 RepID=UPI002871F8CD|nr:phosphotransferase [Paenibacillus sp. VCA1]MDR9856704.1 phosphotransferase [Paenibacillus sp. VCA1]